ncbi:ABC transporter ATP-binding protein [Anaerococcus sp.]|uniref:ABC transporter ATP-binding protein n=1 Tax=Anaerococcus TaxID=165779 RepID=UPI00290556CF|nr:ABC transporter ATP-binding protein [Anaerococcus sp.]MDU2566673.1 ABC transporter ATP-binding protein [Anaerococcus sp.]
MKMFKFNSFKLGILFSIIYALLNVLLMNALSLIIVDKISDLYKSILIILSIYLAKDLLQYLNLRQRSIIEYYLKRQFYFRVDEKYKKISIGDFNKKPIGARGSTYVNDVSKLINLTMVRFLNMTFDAAIIVLILISLLRIHYFLFILGLVLMLFMYILPKLFEKKLSKYIALSQDTTESYLKNITELLSGFTSLVQNNNFNFFSLKSQKSGEKFADDITEADKFAGLMSAVLTVAGDIFTLVSLSLVSYFVITGKVKAGYLLSTLSLIPFLSETISMYVSDKTFYKSGLDLYENRFSEFEEIYTDFYTKPLFFKKKEILPQLEVKEKSVEIKTIESKNIKVYFGAKQIAYDDMIFKAGKKYLIQAPSGYGKSTFIKVLTGQINNIEGDVLINGKKIDNFNVFTSISYIDQNTFLFNESLARNINTDEQTANKLLKLVGIDEYKGEYILSENGKNFSGGQRQKISIIRALARDKKVIFADEITSSLDDESARSVMDILLNMDIMLIMISHKISDEQKKLFDQVVDLEKHTTVYNNIESETI